MRTILKVMLVVVVLISGTVYAQGENRIKDRGVKLGLGLSTLDVTVTGLQRAAEDSYGSGLIAFFITYSLQPRLYLQPEILYASRGAGGEFLRGISWRHDYLEVPVLLKYELTKPAKWTPSLFAGPAFGYLISTKYQPSAISTEIDTKDAAKSMDFSIVLGGALDYRSIT